MALLICPECGHKVSDKAEACPNCGWPVILNTKSEASITALTKVPPKINKKILGLIIVLLLSLGLCFYLCYEFLYLSDQEQADVERVTNHIVALSKDEEVTGGKLRIAKQSYNNLDQRLKRHIKNADDLSTAEQKYDEQSTEKAEYAIAEINKIGVIGFGSKTVISNAREALDNVPDEYKDKVSNISVLESAEQSFKKYDNQLKQSNMDFARAKSKESGNREEAIALYKKVIPEDQPNYTNAQTRISVLEAEIKAEQEEAVRKQQAKNARFQRAANILKAINRHFGLKYSNVSQVQVSTNEHLYLVDTSNRDFYIAMLVDDPPKGLDGYVTKKHDKTTGFTLYEFDYVRETDFSKTMVSMAMTTVWTNLDDMVSPINLKSVLSFV